MIFSSQMKAVVVVRNRKDRQQGFSFLEFLIVISLIAVVYVVALPNLSLTSTSSLAAKLGELTARIRSGFDEAVLTGKTHRMVVELISGRYWLEYTESENFRLGSYDLGRDLFEREESELRELFNEEFQEFEELAGQEIEDPESDRTIKPSSPVLESKRKLAPAVWELVSDPEWQNRSIGPELIVKQCWPEHLDAPVSAIEAEEELRCILYFFPNGQMQRFVMQLYYRSGDRGIDENITPYTLTTNPFMGTADIQSGDVEVDPREGNKS